MRWQNGSVHTQAITLDGTLQVVWQGSGNTAAPAADSHSEKRFNGRILAPELFQIARI